MRWLADDDERCHDERCAGVLDRLDRALTFPAESPASLRPKSTVMLVRALVTHLRESPGLDSVRLGEVLGAHPRRRSPRSEPFGGLLRSS